MEHVRITCLYVMKHSRFVGSHHEATMKLRGPSIAAFLQQAEARTVAHAFQHLVIVVGYEIPLERKGVIFPQQQ